MTAQCTLYKTVPWKFSGLAEYAHGYYSQHFSWAFVPIDPMNIPTKFEVRSFTRSWDNKGYPKNLGSPWIRPRSIFSKILNGLLNVPAKFEVHSFTCSWDEGVAKLQTPNLEEGEAIGGRGWYRSKERLVSSYRPFIVTFPPSLRVSEIFPLLFPRTPFSLPYL